MKWKFSQIGDEKLIKRFAWFPVKFEKEYVWLESYWELWVYDSQMDDEGPAIPTENWRLKARFLDKED